MPRHGEVVIHLPSSGMTQEKLDAMVEKYTASKNANGGTDVNVTIDLKSSSSGVREVDGRMVHNSWYGFSNQEWNGVDDKGIESLISSLVGAINSLESTLRSYGKDLSEMVDIEGIAERLMKPIKDGEGYSINTAKESVQHWKDLLESPGRYIVEAQKEIESLYEPFKKIGGDKYTHKDYGGFTNISKLYGDMQGRISRVQKGIDNGEDAVYTARMVEDILDDTKRMRQSIKRATPQVEKLNHDAETMRASEENRRRAEAAEEQLKAEREKNAAAEKQSEATRQELQAAQQRVAEAERRAQEAQKQSEEQARILAEQNENLQKQLAEAQKKASDAQNAVKKNGNFDGGPGGGGPGGGGGGGNTPRNRNDQPVVPPTPPSPPRQTGSGGPPDGGEIRHFESLRELQDFLSGLNNGELTAFAGQLGERFRELESTVKDITATFDSNDKTLRTVNLSAVHGRFGSAETSNLRYAFNYGLDLDDSGEVIGSSYRLVDSSARTRTDIPKLEKARTAQQERLNALLTKLRSIKNYDIMKGDDPENTNNPLLQEWGRIASFDPSTGEIKLKAVINGLSDIEDAEKAVQQLEQNLKAVNDLMSKRWESNTLKQMTNRYEELATYSKTIPENMRRGGLLDDFNSAKAEYDAAAEAEDPVKQVLAYNKMEEAIRRVKLEIKEMSAAQRESTRTQQEADRVERQRRKVVKDKVALGKFKQKYKEMGENVPQEYRDAQNALKNFNRAKTQEARDKHARELDKHLFNVSADVEARYPQYQRQQREADKKARDAEQRREQTSRQERRRFRTVPGQNVTAEKFRKELADMAQPYGGLGSEQLPEYISKALKQLESFKGEGDLEKRITKLRGLNAVMGNARQRNKESQDFAQAKDLLNTMASNQALAGTQQRIDLDAALRQVDTAEKSGSPNERADAYANLAAQIKTATQAVKEYQEAQEKADKDSLSRDRLQEQASAQVERYKSQVAGIELAFEKMGQSVDTSEAERLIDVFGNEDVLDKNAMAKARADISKEMTRLRDLQKSETAIFNAENKRSDTTESLNAWLSGLTRGEQDLNSIRELQSLLQGLQAIDLRSAGGLEQFNQQLNALMATAEKAKTQVSAIQEYQKVVSSPEYTLMGNEHADASERQKSQDAKKALVSAYDNFRANQDSAEAVQRLNEALLVTKQRMQEVKSIDAFGRLNEQADLVVAQLSALEAKHGPLSGWTGGRGTVAQSLKDTYATYQAQVAGNDFAGAKESLGTMTNQMKALNQSFTKGGDLVGVFDGKLKGLATRLLGFGSAYMALNKVIGVFKQMVGHVTQIDTAMTELRKVTDESSSAYQRFQKQSGKTAVQIGSSVADLINTAVEYGRMGYSLAESQQLGIVTTKFANTGNFNNVTEASDSLIAIIRGFDGLNVGDAEKVSDKLTAVANAYAVTAADIAAGLQNSASSLNVAGVTIDQATAMVTAIAEVTRDASGAGNAIKVMSARIRGAKTE